MFVYSLSRSTIHPALPVGDCPQTEEFPVWLQGCISWGSIADRDLFTFVFRASSLLLLKHLTMDAIDAQGSARGH